MTTTAAAAAAAKTDEIIIIRYTRINGRTGKLYCTVLVLKAGRSFYQVRYGIRRGN